MSEYRSRFDRMNARSKEKVEQAKARQEAADKRSPSEQLARLDEKFGKGVGAKRERAKLNKLLGQIKN